MFVVNGQTDVSIKDRRLGAQ